MASTEIVDSIIARTSGTTHIHDDGDEKLWQELCDHKSSFLFVAESEGIAQNLHVLKWSPGIRKVMPSGVLGSVVCLANARAATALPTSNMEFRVHICRQTPCTAMYNPSKYGNKPPPLRHGRILQLYAADTCVNLSLELRKFGLVEDCGAVSRENMQEKKDGRTEGITFQNTTKDSPSTNIESLQHRKQRRT